MSVKRKAHQRKGYYRWSSAPETVKQTHRPLGEGSSAHAYNKSSFCREIEGKLVTHPNDVEGGVQCIKNQVEKQKQCYSQAKQLASSTGSGDTLSDTLKQLVLRCCPHYFQLEPILGSTYAHDNQVTGTGDAYPAEDPEAVAEEHGSADESEVEDDLVTNTNN